MPHRPLPSCLLSPEPWPPLEICLTFLSMLILRCFPKLHSNAHYWVLSMPFGNHFMVSLGFTVFFHNFSHTTQRVCLTVHVQFRNLGTAQVSIMLWTHPRSCPTYYIYIMCGFHDEVASFSLILVCFSQE